MAKVILNKREALIWKTSGKSVAKKIYNCLNTLAGLFGGHGIDLVDQSDNDLSYDKYQLSYCNPLRTFRIGDRVITKSILTEGHQFIPGTFRVPSSIGTIVQLHNSHGLCYEVYHEREMAIGWYDPVEISLDSNRD